MCGAVVLRNCRTSYARTSCSMLNSFLSAYIYLKIMHASMFYRRRGGYGYRWIGGTFEHFFVPSLGIFTLNFAPNCDFVKLREGYFITLKTVLPSPGSGIWRKGCRKICMPHQYLSPPLCSNVDTCIEFFYFIVTNEVHPFLCCCEPAVTQEKWSWYHYISF